MEFKRNFRHIKKENKVSLTLAERALAPDSPANHGICSIINGGAIDSTATPHLNGDPGTVITIPGESFRPGDG
jgi:predicted nucleotide-binding protein (sugar kinase/HSP70/actin superfamily)